MEPADSSVGRQIRPGAFVAVLLLHVVAILALIRAFAPDFTAQVTERVLATFTVTVTAPEPSPTPVTKPEARADAAQAPPARKALPKPVSAPVPKLVLAPRSAPSVSAQGSALGAGASIAGAGSGAGGQGLGLGSGSQGTGDGGGTAKMAVKIAGDIQSARDYPRETRALRLGDFVEIVLGIDREGRVGSCRVQRASRDAQADRITCQLARQRFRFEPATDSAGNAVASSFGWRQRWFN